MAEFTPAWPLRPRSNNLPAGSALTTVLLAVVVVTLLYFGREVLVPIALAILLSLVLAPLVRLLQGWYIPRSLSVLAVVLFAFAAIFGLGGLMVSQVNQLAADLPKYQSTLQEKIQSLRGAAAGTGTLERASDVLLDLSKELDKPPTNARPVSSLTNERPSPDKPIQVEVRQPDPGSLQTLVALITPLIHPLTTTGIVVIFVIFILIQKQDLRNRLVRLAGSRDLQRTTAAMDDAGQRLSRLFLTQLALNAGFGLVIGIGLWVIGVPSAPLWGMLAMILRFVPYIGAIISAVFPLILAAAIGPDWGMALWTLALFLVVEPIVGHFIEPLLYGQSSGLSPVAIIASATFWTWLWGPVGLILATPLTICLVVMGRHVDRLKFLDVMLGNQPALTPPELIYQRMLAGDPVEAAEHARIFLKGKSLTAYYEEVLTEGLKLAQADAKLGLLEPERISRIRDAAAEIVDDLSGHEDTPEIASSVGNFEGEDGAPLAQVSNAEAPAVDPAQQVPERWRIGMPVLCIPGTGLLDEAYAIVLSQLIGRRGVGARPEQAGILSMSRLLDLDTKGVALICLCYVENATSAQIRYSIRRVRKRAPHALVLVSLLGGTESITDGEELASNVAVVGRSLNETVERIVAAAIKAPDAPPDVELARKDAA